MVVPPLIPARVLNWFLFSVGFWETMTYGLIGLYKSDWKRTKGFNLVKYKHKWGGEDWDALDK